ncbi:hypothetical protein HPB50_007753 [Hyalomma asiaticum]|uniref:Uncharacterized protein n=1 Tax=Hyalomma asiaticum TaxID=266040 RepID=A0ACB7TGP7_HYAAI|nr:hypothetical protein HPB50_007753 [Hyalomma asiaticum]
MMFFQVNSTDSPRRAKKKWLEFCVSTGRMTEFIWQHMLAHLRAITPWKKPSPSNPIHTACEVPIPDCVQRVLSLGPKFATQPQLAPLEMLTLVRQVAKRAPEAETDRCVAEGIQCPGVPPISWRQRHPVLQVYIDAAARDATPEHKKALLLNALGVEGLNCYLRAVDEEQQPGADRETPEDAYNATLDVLESLQPAPGPGVRPHAIQVLTSAAR